MDTNSQQTYQISNDFILEEKQLYNKYKELYLEKKQDQLKYGTAGFREHSQYLDYICLRCGLFMSIYSKAFPKQALGIIITASHNHIQDNGVKFVEVNGTHMPKNIEKVINIFINQQNLIEAIEDLIKHLQEFFNRKIDLQQEGLIFVARDTRPSGILLLDYLKKGLNGFQSQIKDLGEVTTPQIFFLVNCYNFKLHQLNINSEPKDIIDKYYDEFVISFINFLNEIDYQPRNGQKQLVVVDCANGVGGLTLNNIKEQLTKYYNFELVNNDNRQMLNEQCGSEYITHDQKLPMNFDKYVDKLHDGMHFVSFDGDCDRVVYMQIFKNNTFKIFDGDRIFSLISLYLSSQLKKLIDLQNLIQITINTKTMLDFSQWTMGVTFSAYTNGGCINYLKNTLKLTTVISAVGMKNLYREAEKFDLGVFFESNGHGTFLFSTDKLQILKKLISFTKQQDFPQTKDTIAFQKALVQFFNFIKTANRTARGDGIANSLLVELTLTAFGMTENDWSNLYKDYISKTTKVQVNKRLKIKTNVQEDQVLEPLSLKTQLENELKNYSQVRAFVRASGTEDKVKIYVEGEDEQTVNNLSKKITEIVENNEELK